MMVGVLGERCLFRQSGGLFERARGMAQVDMILKLGGRDKRTVVELSLVSPSLEECAREVSLLWKRAKSLNRMH